MEPSFHDMADTPGSRTDRQGCAAQRADPMRRFVIFACLLLLLLLVWGIQVRQRLDPRLSAVAGLDDIALHAATIAELSAGAPYYVAVGTQLRSRGYPSASIANWRTPLHYRAIVALGSTRASQLLTTLALSVIALGAYACRARFAGAWFVSACVLLGTMTPALLVRPGGVVMAEIWAGVLIGLAIALYQLRAWTVAALVGVLAIFMRELAAPFGLVCGLLALRARRRAEIAVWVWGAVSYAVYYTWHALHVIAAIQPTDYAWPHSWVRLLGWPFVLQTAWVSGWTIMLPYVVTPVVAVIALCSTIARAIPPQLRWPVLVYVAFFCVVGQEFNHYWGFVTAPLWTFALLYSPDGIRTIWCTLRHEGSRRAHGDAVCPCRSTGCTSGCVAAIIRIRPRPTSA
jgi:hypothetical protein